MELSIQEIELMIECIEEKIEGQGGEAFLYPPAVRKEMHKDDKILLELKEKLINWSKLPEDILDEI